MTKKRGDVRVAEVSEEVEGEEDLTLEEKVEALSDVLLNMHQRVEAMDEAMVSMMKAVIVLLNGIQDSMNPDLTSSQRLKARDMVADMLSSMNGFLSAKEREHAARG